MRLCSVVQEFEDARWQLPDVIRTKHTPIVSHYQQVCNNLQSHQYPLRILSAYWGKELIIVLRFGRLTLGQTKATLDQVHAEKGHMEKLSTELSTRAEALSSLLRALEQKVLFRYFYFYFFFVSSLAYGDLHVEEWGHQAASPRRLEQC